MDGKTLENLKQAFAGESQANRRYLAFAHKADDEGYAQAAKLFRAAADSETVHALKHLNATGSIGETTTNLKTAIAGETYEFEQMYPPMIDEAEAEGQTAAKISFRNANVVEKEHALLYQAMLDNMENPEFVDYYVCQVCGHVHINEAPDKCPVCGAAKKMFKKID
ncbi:MAG TPA: rubrerythrin family protein [Candidatus Aquicultor sp.]|jgi:rubrerythrin